MPATDNKYLKPGYDAAVRKGELAAVYYQQLMTQAEELAKLIAYLREHGNDPLEEKQMANTSRWHNPLEKARDRSDYIAKLAKQLESLFAL